MANKTILLDANGDRGHDEAPAAAALSPGHLITKDSNGAFAKHASLGNFADKCFAKEDAYRGKTTADAYATADTVFAHYAVTGERVNALLKPGVSYAKGDELISAGDGTLMKRTAASTTTLVKQVIAKVEVALNLSATGAVAAVTAVRIC